MSCVILSKAEGRVEGSLNEKSFERIPSPPPAPRRDPSIRFALVRMTRGKRIDVLLTQLDVLPLRVNSMCERCTVTRWDIKPVRALYQRSRLDHS
jgi:hypothetical protein